MDAFYASVEQRDSAMPMVRARRLCPDLAVVELRMDHYREVSQQIRAVLEGHTAFIEPLALDEFYVDVTTEAATIAEAGHLAQTMRAEIRARTGLVASAGVGPNKFVAKVASGPRPARAPLRGRARLIALAPLRRPRA